MFYKINTRFYTRKCKVGCVLFKINHRHWCRGLLAKVVTHRLEVDIYFTDLYSARSKGVIKNASKLIR